eukprot:6338989-Prymnesium_polylepis.1
MGSVDMGSAGIASGGIASAAARWAQLGWGSDGSSSIASSESSLMRRESSAILPYEGGASTCHMREARALAQPA